MTSSHLLVTYYLLHVVRWLKSFEHKPFDTHVVVSFANMNGISTCLINLSLGFIFVGFYQVASLKRPLQPHCLSNHIFFTPNIRHQYLKTHISGSVTNLQLNLLGYVISCLAIVITNVAHIVSFHVDKCSINALQHIQYAKTNKNHTH